MRFWIFLGCLTMAAAGCSNKTETGYEPRTLGDSWAVQRGYYATPFSPEARQAQMDPDIGYRRPTQWRR